MVFGRPLKVRWTDRYPALNYRRARVSLTLFSSSSSSSLSLFFPYPFSIFPFNLPHLPLLHSPSPSSSTPTPSPPSLSTSTISLRSFPHQPLLLPLTPTPSSLSISPLTLFSIPYHPLLLPLLLLFPLLRLPFSLTRLRGRGQNWKMALGEKQEETWKGHNGNVARDGVIHLSPTKAKPASGQSGR